MGKLLKALSPQSSYAAKGGAQGGGTLWDELTDRIAGCLLIRDLEEFEAWVEFNELSIPYAYRPPLHELIELRRAELEAEDIGQILRDRFDFT